MKMKYSLFIFLLLVFSFHENVKGQEELEKSGGETLPDAKDPKEVEKPEEVEKTDADPLPETKNGTEPGQDEPKEKGPLTCLTCGVEGQKPCNEVFEGESTECPYARGRQSCSTTFYRNGTITKGCAVDPTNSAKPVFHQIDCIGGENGSHTCFCNKPDCNKGRSRCHHCGPMSDSDCEVCGESPLTPCKNRRSISDCPYVAQSCSTTVYKNGTVSKGCLTDDNDLTKGLIAPEGIRNTTFDDGRINCACNGMRCNNHFDCKEHPKEEQPKGPLTCLTCGVEGQKPCNEVFEGESTECPYEKQKQSCSSTFYLNGTITKGCAVDPKDSAKPVHKSDYDYTEGEDGSQTYFCNAPNCNEGGSQCYHCGPASGNDCEVCGDSPLQPCKNPPRVSVCPFVAQSCSTTIYKNGSISKACLTDDNDITKGLVVPDGIRNTTFEDGRINCACNGIACNEHFDCKEHPEDKHPKEKQPKGPLTCLSCGLEGQKSCSEVFEGESTECPYDSAKQSCSSTLYKNGTVTKGCAVNRKDSARPFFHPSNCVWSKDRSQQTCYCNRPDCNEQRSRCYQCGPMSDSECDGKEPSSDCPYVAQSCSTTVYKNGTVSKGCLTDDNDITKGLLAPEGIRNTTFDDGRVNCVCNSNRCNEFNDCKEHPKKDPPSKEGPLTCLTCGLQGQKPCNEVMKQEVTVCPYGREKQSCSTTYRRDGVVTSGCAVDPTDPAKPVHKQHHHRENTDFDTMVYYCNKHRCNKVESHCYHCGPMSDSECGGEEPVSFCPFAAQSCSTTVYKNGTVSKGCLTDDNDITKGLIAPEGIRNTTFDDGRVNCVCNSEQCNTDANCDEHLKEPEKMSCLSCGIDGKKPCDEAVDEDIGYCFSNKQSCSTTYYDNGTISKGCVVDPKDPYAGAFKPNGCGPHGSSPKICYCDTPNCNVQRRTCYTCGIAPFDSCDKRQVWGACPFVAQSCSTTVFANKTVVKGCLTESDETVKGVVEPDGLRQKKFEDGRISCVCNSNKCNKHDDCEKHPDKEDPGKEDPPKEDPTKAPEIMKCLSCGLENQPRCDEIISANLVNCPYSQQSCSTTFYSNGTVTKGCAINDKIEPVFVEKDDCEDFEDGTTCFCNGLGCNPIKSECMQCGTSQSQSCKEEQVGAFCPFVGQSCSTTVFPNGTVTKGCLTDDGNPPKGLIAPEGIRKTAHDDGRINCICNRPGCNIYNDCNKHPVPPLPITPEPQTKAPEPQTDAPGKETKAPKPKTDAPVKPPATEKPKPEPPATDPPKPKPAPEQKAGVNSMANLTAITILMATFGFYAIAKEF